MMGKDLGFFLRKLQENSEEKIINGVYINFRDYNGYFILFMYVFFLMCLLFLPKFIFIAFILVFVFSFSFQLNMIGALGLTKNNVIIIRNSYFGEKVREVYEIGLKDFKNIEVKKSLIFRFNIVRLSFVDKKGKFRRKKICYSNRVFGKGFKMQKDNGKKIYDVLLNEQKIMEKGDF